jgi:hypothetical protein
MENSQESNKQELKHTFLGEDNRKLAELEYWNSQAVVGELKSFGSDIFIECFTKGDRVIDPTLGAHMMLRQFLIDLDAIDSLLNLGATEQCILHTRSLFELAIQIKYMLADDAENRGMNYNLMFKLKQLGYFQKIEIGSEKRKQLSSNIKSDEYGYLFKVPDYNMLKKEHNDLVDFLEQGPLKVSYKKFNELKKKNGKGPKNWYSLDKGPSNLEQLAQKVGYPALYTSLYRDFSAHAHGELAVPGKVSYNKSGMAEVSCLREYNLDQCTRIVHHSIIFSQICFSAFVSGINSEKINEFNEWKYHTNKFKPKTV